MSKLNKKTGKRIATNCLNCFHILDVHDTFGKKDAKPKEGDISLCGYCGHIMAFNADGTVRPLTSKEVYDIAGDPKLIKLEAVRTIVFGKAKKDEKAN
jgi:hypothetical protein